MVDGERLQPLVANIVKQRRLREQDMVRRMGPNGAALVLVQDLFGLCLVPICDRCCSTMSRPERHGRVHCAKLKIIYEWIRHQWRRYRTWKHRRWKIASEKRPVTRKECRKARGPPCEEARPPDSSRAGALPAELDTVGRQRRTPLQRKADSRQSVEYNFTRWNRTLCLSVVG